jgi:hypothetical protein
MPASARVMTSTTNGLRGAMKPSISVRGLSAICGAAASLLAFGDGATMGEKMRGALTAGAALNPGLNAEAADSIAASTTNIAATADTISRRPPPIRISPRYYERPLPVGAPILNEKGGAALRDSLGLGESRAHSCTHTTGPQDSLSLT